MVMTDSKVLLIENTDLLPGKVRQIIMQLVLPEVVTPYPRNIKLEETASLFRKYEQVWLAGDLQGLSVWTIGKKEADRLGLCLTSHNAWRWFISSVCPNIQVMELEQTELPFSSLHVGSIMPNSSFQISFLQSFFHDLSNRIIAGNKRLIACEISRWLSSLNEPMLEPFHYLCQIQQWVKLDNELNCSKLKGTNVEQIVQEVGKALSFALSSINKDAHSGSIVWTIQIDSNCRKKSEYFNNLDSFYSTICRIYMAAK